MSARTRPRLLTVLVTVGLIAGFVLVAPTPTRVLAEPAPTIYVQDGLLGLENFTDSDVRVEISNPAGDLMLAPDTIVPVSAFPINPADYDPDPTDGIDVQLDANWDVTVTGVQSGVSKHLHVVYLFAMWIDPDNDTVGGDAEPDTTVVVEAFAADGTLRGTQTVTTIGATVNWQADFTGIAELQDGDWFRALIIDVESDYIVDEYSRASRGLGASLTGDGVWGSGWPHEVGTANVWIDDVDGLGPLGPFPAAISAQSDGFGLLPEEIGNPDLTPGDVITIDDGIVSLSHTLTGPLTANLSEDGLSASGEKPENEPVSVLITGPDCPERLLAGVETGPTTWELDLSPHCPDGLFQHGFVSARHNVEHGWTTAEADPVEPDPGLDAQLGASGLGTGVHGWAWNWDQDSEVQLELFERVSDDPPAWKVNPTSTTAVYPSRFAEGATFSAAFDTAFAPGDRIVATGTASGIVRKLIVQDIRVTSVDRETGVVEGTTTIAGPVNVVADIEDASGHFPEQINRFATMTGPNGDGVYDWTVNFMTPADQTDEFGNPTEFGDQPTGEIDVLSGHAYVGNTGAAYSTPRIQMSTSNQEWWSNVSSVDEDVRLTFDDGAQHFETAVHSPWLDQTGIGSVGPDLNQVDGLVPALGDGAGWTVSVVAADDAEVLAGFELPLLTLDSVNTTTGEITGQAGPLPLFIDVNTGGPDGWDGTQIEVASSPWSWSSWVAERNISAMWNSQAGSGHDLQLFYAWPSFTYMKNNQEQDGSTGHFLSSFHGAPLAVRGAFPLGAVMVTVDDPTGALDQTHPVPITEDANTTGFHVDLGSWGILPEDVGPGWTFTVSTEIAGVPMSKTLVIHPVSVDQVDNEAGTAFGTASGTCSPNVADKEWIVQIGRGDMSTGYTDDLYPECMPDGTWEVNFDTSQPASYVQASYQDGDGDVNTSGRYPHIDQPSNPPLITAIVKSGTVQFQGDWSGGLINITIDGDDQGNFNYEDCASGCDGLPVNVGSDITVSDGPTTKHLKVTSLSLLGVDPVASTVEGTSSPGRDVEILNWGDTLTIPHDGTGTWTADFSVTNPFNGQADGWASQTDDEGDQTWVWWTTPRMHVEPRGTVAGQGGWYEGDTVVVETFRPSDDPLTDDPLHRFEVTAGSSDIGPEDSWRIDDISEFGGGYTVVAEDHQTTRTHEVRPVTIVTIDTDSDTVSGTTTLELGDRLSVQADRCSRDDVSVTAGSYTAYFSVPGTQSHEQDTCDLNHGSSGDVLQYDDDGDFTILWWNVPEPRQLEVYPELDLVGGWDAELTLTVKRGGIQVYPDGPDPATGYRDFALWQDGFDLLPGDLVTVSDGVTTKDHLVRAQTITELLPDPVNRVSGTAPEGTTISVRYNTIASQLGDDDLLEDGIYTVDASGTWTHDFPAGFPVEAGIAIEVEVRDQPDADNDTTKVVAYVPAPTITAWPQAGSAVEGRGWPAGMPVDISVGDGTDTFDVSPSPVPDRVGGFPWDTAFIAELYNQAEEYWQLEPGHVVIATTADLDGDGQPDLRKDLTVAGLTLEVVDTNSGFFDGHAPPDETVYVTASNEWEHTWRNVIAAPDTDPDPGYWSADLSTLGPDDDGDGEMGVPFAQNTGYSAQVYDEDGDATSFGGCHECDGGGGPGPFNWFGEGDVIISSTDGRLLVYHQDGNISEYFLPFGGNFDIQYYDNNTLFIAAQDQGVMALDLASGDSWPFVQDPELQAIAVSIQRDQHRMFISDEDSGVWIYEWINDDWWDSENATLTLLIDEVPDPDTLGATLPASADALVADLKAPSDEPDDESLEYGWVYFASVGTPIYRFDPNAPDPEATVEVFVDNPTGRAFNGMVINNYQDLTVAAGDAVMIFNGYGDLVADITVPGARSIEDVAVVFPGDPPPDGYPRSDMWVIDSGYVDGEFGVDPALYYIADPVGGLVDPVVTEAHRGGPFGDTVDLLIAQQPPDGGGGPGPFNWFGEGDVIISSTDGRLLVYHQDGNISEYFLPFGGNFDIQYYDNNTLFIAAQDQGVMALDLASGDSWPFVQDPELQAIAVSIQRDQHRMFISDEDSGVWIYEWINDDWWDSENATLTLLIDEVPDPDTLGATLPASADALVADLKAPSDEPDDESLEYGWVYFASVGTPIYRFDPNAPDPEATVEVFVDNPTGRAFNGMVINNYQDLTVAAGDAVMIFNGYGDLVADITVPGARSIEDVAVVFPGDPPPDGYPRSDMWVIDSGYVDGEFGVDPALYYIADPVGGLVDPVVTEAHRGGPFGDTVDLLIAQQPPDGGGGPGPFNWFGEGDVIISSTDGRLLVYHQDGNISEYFLPFGGNFDIQYYDNNTLFIAAQDQGVMALDLASGDSWPFVQDPELQAIAVSIQRDQHRMFISDEDSGVWIYEWINDDWWDSENATLTLLIDEVPDPDTLGATLPASADALVADLKAPSDEPDDESLEYGWVYFASVGTPIYRFDPNAPDPEATVEVFVDNPTGRAFNGMVINNYQDLTVAAGDAVMIFNGYGDLVADITVPGARSIEDVAVVFPGDPPPDGYPRSDMWVIDSGYVDGEFGVDPALYYIADPVGGLVDPVVTEAHRGGPFGDTVDLLIAQQPPDGGGGEGPGELHLHAMAYGNEWLSGEGLPSGMYVIQIEGAGECSNLVYREGSEFHVDGAELCDDGDLKPGHHVVVSAVAEDGVSPGQLIAEFTIDGVVISGADVGSDTVWGLATDGKPVTIGLFDESTEEPVAWRTVDLADEESEWSVDFRTAPDPETEDNWGAGALAGRSVWAAQFDAQGHTESDWMEAEPRLFVNLIEDFIQLSGWPGDVPAMLRILESDAAGAAVVYEEQIVTSSPYYVLFTQLDLGGFDVLAGQRVVASADDASVEVAHTVSELSITGVDFELDLLAGTATNGAEHHLLVGVGNESGEAQLEPAGSPWTADFNGLVDFSATNTIQGFVAEFDAGESATFFQFEAEYQEFVVPPGGGSVGTDDGTVVIGNLGEGDVVGIVEGPVPPSTSEFDYVGGTYELIWEGAPRTFADPLILTFRIPGDEIPAGLNLDAIFVFKDGIEAPDCPTVPDSDGDFPCVLERIRDGASGDVLITVQALTAGVWTAAIPGGGVDPHLHAVVYGAEWIHGEGLPPAGYVVWIQDAAECQSLLYLSGSEFHVDGTELCDDGDLQPDHHVVVSTIGSDGLPYRTIAEFTIDGVVISGADVGTRTVWGLATDGKPVTIGLFDESTGEPVAWRTVDLADEESEWSVDFTTAPDPETEDNWGAGALAGRSVWAAQFDAQGHTESDWVDVEPHIYVNRITDAVVLENWPTGGPITLEVFASDTVDAPPLHTEYVSSNHTELDGFDLLAGQYVVATAGAVEVAHSVAAIGVESFDFVEDSYDGIATAEPGSTVRTGVWYEQGGRQEGSVELWATPEWTADFTEQGLNFSATNRIEGYVAEFDQGGNATFYEFAAEYEELTNDNGTATSSNGEVTVTGLEGSDNITMTGTDSSDVGDGFQTVGTSVDVDGTDDDGNPVVRDFEAGDQPLILTLRILGDDMPDDLSLEDILVFRNWVEVPSCPDVLQSNNDFPCVSAREWVDGDVELTVQTLAFSLWTMAFRLVDIAVFSAPTELIAVGSPVETSGSFDVGATDFTAVIHWDDGSCSVTGVDDAAFHTTHEYADPGVYTPVLEVYAGSRTCADLAGEDPIDSATYRYVVVYDPDGGFVTGGGWIDSPAGAYTPNPELTGRANFGFVMKYNKGKDTPDGNTNFQFQTAGLHFQSIAYEWLVITGGEKAKYKGVGTINGEGTYGFMLTARDSDDGDTFRIKIWDPDSEDTVYDNKPGSGYDSYDATLLGGGSIVIHNGR